MIVSQPILEKVKQMSKVEALDKDWKYKKDIRVTFYKPEPFIFQC